MSLASRLSPVTSALPAPAALVAPAADARRAVRPVGATAFGAGLLLRLGVALVGTVLAASAVALGLS